MEIIKPNVPFKPYACIYKATISTGEFYINCTKDLDIGIQRWCREFYSLCKRRKKIEGIDIKIEWVRFEVLAEVQSMELGIFVTRLWKKKFIDDPKFVCIKNNIFYP